MERIIASFIDMGKKTDAFLYKRITFGKNKETLIVITNASRLFSLKTGDEHGDGKR